MEAEKSLKEDWILWLLLAAALALLLGYWLVLPDSGNDSGEPSWLFADVPAGSIRSIRRYENETLQLELSRSPDGSGWTISEPSGLEEDPRAIDRWVKTLLDPDITRRFKARPDSDYGFAESDTHLQVVVNETPHDLYIGGESPTGDGFYFRYGSDARAPVFLVSSSTKNTLDLTRYDARQKVLFDRQPGDLTQLELRTGEQRVRYRRVGSDWTLEKPKNETLNDTKNQSAQKALSTLLDVNADRFYDGGVPSEYEPLQGEVTLRFGDESILLRIGGRKDGKRLVRIGKGPVMAVAQDPAEIMEDLPRMPSRWPVNVPDHNSSDDTSFPERIHQMEPGGPSRN